MLLRGDVRRWLGLILVVTLALAGWSIGGALLRPGTDSVAARLAEWARDHGMSRLVTFAENQQYQRNRPKVGGTLSPEQQAALRDGAAPQPTVSLPAAVQPLVTPALPGEGEWQSLVKVNNQPVVMKALVRPDPAHTSYLAYVAWLSTKHLRFVLQPGTQEPGRGPWSLPTSIPQGQRRGLAATFNGGFRLQDALVDTFGGYYADGRAVGQLRDGFAAEIFHRDGSMTIGQWGRDASLGDTNIVAVRENLHLLVDNGQVSPSVTDGSGRIWGRTVKSAYYVWRSGVGVTANGNIIFALGPTLSVRSIAEVLQRAGAVRAMELDINPSWVSFMSYDPAADPNNPTPVKLTEFQRPADRYYQLSSRDFVAAYLK